MGQVLRRGGRGKPLPYDDVEDGLAITYTNVNTMVRAMYAKVFGASEYEELFRQSSVKFCLMYLKGKEEYAEQLSDVEGDIHRGELEKILKDILDKDVEKILQLLEKKDQQKVRDVMAKKWAPGIDIVGARADVLNILSIYRAKKYFEMGKAETKKKLIPMNYKLGRDILDKMCEQADIADLLGVIGTTHYGKVFKYDNDDMETSANEYLYGIYKRELRQGSQELSVIVAYIFLREIEIRNIINIIEGIRYGLDLGKIKGKLII